MKALGLVGSARKLGNTEILVKEALIGPAEMGYEVRLLRLTDLEVKPCLGCMKCVFKGVQCAIKDDMNFLIEQILNCDILIIGAPTYLLAPAGIIKMIMDRIYMVSSAKREKWEGKLAGTVAVAGILGWESFMLSLLNMFPLSLGFSLVDTFLVHAPGPGEVLLVDTYLERARLLGESLCGKRSSSGEDNKMVCPLCRGSVFIVSGIGRGECPSCRIKGSFAPRSDGQVAFIADNKDDNRWTPQSIRDHTEKWIKFTEGLFKEHLKEVIRRREPYKEMDNLWVTPIRTKI